MNETEIIQSSFVFDKVIQVEYRGNVNGIQLYSGYCDQEWRIRKVMHGGYLLSMILNAFTHHFRNVHPHPIQISAHFLNTSIVGPCEIEIQDIKAGKTQSVAYAILKQKNGNLMEESIEKIHATVIFGDLNKEKGISQPYYDVIPLPKKSDCELFELDPTLLFMHDHLKILLDTQNKNSNRAERKHWIKFNDERQLDIISLGAFCDFIFPATTNYLERSLGECWHPTLTLEIQFKNLPKGQWVAGSFRSRFLRNGRNEVDGELWDESGNLLCITRHMCLITPIKTNL
ncbi:19336_t:CDS:2 [Funneliformis geosporum]|uniref:15777_t:CDS:1 n=1 Tax=Funneliformis geosporum TaxID=1117311 RepID=A0A9W4WZI4_9GLOM|nr:19336_t:CDS:2 [Funneliformis geosporum]CAI2175215.1 15777_t:CDS:2 [Funneliformis geosporum]